LRSSRCGSLSDATQAIGPGAQRKLGVGAAAAGGVDGGEQQLGQRLLHPPPLGRIGGRRGALALLEQAGEVIGRLAQHLGGLGDVGLLLPGRDRAPLQLSRVQQRGKVLGHVGERLGGAALDFALDLVPVAENIPCGLWGASLDQLGGLPGLGAEDVWMAADQLLAAGVCDRGQVAGLALLEQQGQEVDLEEDVAELVEQLAVIAPADGIGQLVGLLDRMRDDRARVLLAVPRAFAAQAPGDLIEVLERSEVRRRGYWAPGVRPWRPLGTVAELVPAPAGCGPCGEPPVVMAKGVEVPGSAGVGPVPVHWSCPALLLAP
jgi:hypothetical protein